MMNDPNRTEHADLGAVKVAGSFGNHVSTFFRVSYGWFIVAFYPKLTGSIAGTVEADSSG